MLNPYFQTAPYQQATNERDLYEDLIIEAIQINGMEVFYVPRKIVYEDDFFREDRFSQYRESFPIEMYMEDYSGFTGAGEFYDKFGLHMPDQARMMVSRRRWDEVVSQYSTTSQLPSRPAEGDLIYIGGDINDILQIKFVEHEEQQFYQLGKIFIYQLKCEKFVYTHNVMNTSNEDFDSNYLASDDLIATLESLPTMEEMQTPREDLGEHIGVGDFPFAKNFDIEKRADSVLVTEEENIFGKVGGKSPGKRRKII